MTLIDTSTFESVTQPQRGQFANPTARQICFPLAIAPLGFIIPISQMWKWRLWDFK